MKIENILGIKYPLFQGAMAWISHSSLVSSVSNAGGLGILGGGSLTKEACREEIRKIKALTDKPFALNIMLMSPHSDDLAELAIEEDIKIIVTGAGNPSKYMKKWKEHGIIVIPVVASVALAKRMERLGADAIIAEGTEAGGHIGELTTMVLVPQVVDAVSIPVIAAGGIADKRGVKAAFALGAQGVQLGTRFLVAKECTIPQQYKDEIISAKDTDSTVTGRITGHPVRVLKNRMTRQIKEIENASGMSVEEKIAKIEELTMGSFRKAVVDGDTTYSSLMSGQIAGLVKKEETAEEIIKSLFE